MVGDEAVIPAIAVSLDRINPGIPVLIEAFATLPKLSHPSVFGGI
jgi:hypothetical protein